MGEVCIIGLDLAKNVFQAHRAGADGSIVFRRKVSCAQLLKCLKQRKYRGLAFRQKIVARVDRLVRSYHSCPATVRLGDRGSRSTQYCTRRECPKEPA